ncbi:MAG: AAA family ATPase, partial [Anaerolineales bacterium]|nr:AAA family ATPase [Anaerolineales bacterium]
YMPPNRAEQVGRPHLLAKLAGQPQTRLLLVSAPAGYGKTTLLTSWLRQQTDKTVCWVSLDGDDSNPTQFFAYLALAIRPLPNAQSSLRQLLQANQPLPATAFAKALVQDIAPVTVPFILVLDDYHRLDAPTIDEAVAFLLQYMPPQMQVVIATREDPPLPLARLRAQNQLVELRGHELRFNQVESAQFLREVMGLRLTTAAIAALESRTEGWIAGLQLAALALQGQADTEQFIASFSGSHRFVLDYLVEEVLQQQPASVQTFLLETAVLHQLTGSLCNAITDNDNGQETLETLERANLFLVPLDNERHWYRYHHLFADLLRQRLQQNMAARDIATLHARASQWYEQNGLELEAFHHATAANDTARALRLIEGNGLPLYFRGEAIPVRHWLESLTEAEFKARPALWVTYASVLTMT